MTTLVHTSEHSVESPTSPQANSTRALAVRLKAESEHHVPFSRVKALLREAACEVERLEAELTRLMVDKERERLARHAPRPVAL